MHSLSLAQSYAHTLLHVHTYMGLFTTRTSMPSIFQFSQDTALKEALLGTEGMTMVEAAPRDTVWGIGLGAKNRKAMNRQQELAGGDTHSSQGGDSGS